MWAGWSAGARAAVIDLSGDDPARWGLGARLAWESVEAMGMREPGAAGEELERDDRFAGRLETWSDEPPPESADATHPDVERLERACERRIARGRGPRAAVFLDRDGTLVVERGYLARSEDIELLPGVAQALRVLRAAGFALVVVSNQSGVGRGLFPLSRVYEAMARLRTLLRAEGVELDAVYFCPHRPEAGCDCRKPSAELLRRAAHNLGLSLRDSVMLGDKLLDVETGHAAGARGVLLRSGYGRDEEQRWAGGESTRAPDLVADDLPAAVGWLVERHPTALTA
jgi:D-glycero-D-manno-heptose 1,7-bisphosphate phosphatase